MKKPLLFGIILTACVVIVAFVFAQFYPEGMISYWKFDEGSGLTASDSVDGNHGTINGATRTTGQVDDALSFNGTYDYVKVPDHASLDFGPGQDFSLEAWIKATQDQAEWQGTILAKLNAPSQPSGSVKRDYGYSLMVRGVKDGNNEGKIGVWLGDGDRTDPCFNLYSVNTYDDDTWHHVVATMDRDGLARLYVDGLEVNNADISHLSLLDESNSENLEIGREGVYDTYRFNGLIDEVAIYDRVLFPEEIEQHYLNGVNESGYEVECVLPPSGMVSWWPGDENADDIQCTNDGTLNGAIFVAGKVGQAFRMDGNDCVAVADDLTLNPLMLTVDAWIRTTFLPSPYSAHFIVAKSGSDGYHGYELGTTTGGKVRFTVLAGGFPYGDLSGATVVADGEWHHIAGTYDGSSLRIYVDGNLDANGSYTGGIGYIGSSPLYIGKRQYGGIPGFFNGEIDEVEIFARALSQTEIQAIYTASSAGKCKEFVIEVDIDIKPGSYPNSINLGSRGSIPVAILSSACFDATTVDPDTVILAGAGVAVRGKGNKFMAHVEDVNGDGLDDLVVQVETENLESGLFQDGYAFLTGKTYDAKAIGGFDEITIVPGE